MSYKLIRDNIPALYKASEGKSLKYATVEDPTFFEELILNKLKEELAEFGEAMETRNKDKVLEELADIMTVVSSLPVLVNATKEDLMEVYQAKMESNGGFDKHLIGLFDEEIK